MRGVLVILALFVCVLSVSSLAVAQGSHTHQVLLSAGTTDSTVTVENGLSFLSITAVSDSIKVTFESGEVWFGGDSYVSIPGGETKHFPFIAANKQIVQYTIDRTNSTRVQVVGF